MSEMFIEISRMGRLANRALRAKTKNTIRKYSQRLFEQAVECSPEAKEFLETDRPYDTAALIIETVTTDDRLFYEIPPESIKPDDRYSIYLRELAENIPYALGYLARQQQELDLLSSV